MFITEGSMLYAGWDSTQDGVEQAKAFIYANEFTTDDVKLQRRIGDTVIWALRDIEVRDGTW